MAKPTPTPPPEPWELVIPIPVEPGVYPATIKSVERRVAEEDDDRPWLLWTVTLEDGREVSGGSSFSLAAGSKPYAWVSAVLGRALMGGGRTIHPMDLEGKPCLVHVDLKEDGLSSKVVAILPPAKGKAAKESPSIEDLMDEPAP